MRGEPIEKILTDILWGTPIHSLSVFSRNDLPHSGTLYPSADVANTDPSSLPGQHYVAFYQLSPIPLEFFDSSGCPPEY